LTSGSWTELWGELISDSVVTPDSGAYGTGEG